MLAPLQDANAEYRPPDVNLPLSVLLTVLSLAVILGPHLVRWWKKRRDARRP